VVYGKHGQSCNGCRRVGNAEDDTFGKHNIKIKNGINQRDGDKQCAVYSAEKEQRNQNMNKPQFKFFQKVFRRKKEDKSADAI